MICRDIAHIAGSRTGRTDRTSMRVVLCGLGRSVTTQAVRSPAWVSVFTAMGCSVAGIGILWITAMGDNSYVAIAASTTSSRPSSRTPHPVNRDCHRPSGGDRSEAPPLCVSHRIYIGIHLYVWCWLVHACMLTCSCVRRMQRLLYIDMDQLRDCMPWAHRPANLCYSMCICVPTDRGTCD